VQHDRGRRVPLASPAMAPDHDELGYLRHVELL
jgi:hypothetical protein